MVDSSAVIADSLDDRYDIGATAKYLLQKKIRCVALQVEALFYDASINAALEKTKRTCNVNLQLQCNDNNFKMKTSPSKSIGRTP